MNSYEYFSGWDLPLAKNAFGAVQDLHPWPVAYRYVVKYGPIMGVRVSQVKPSNCFRLHHTSMISKHSAIPVPDKKVKLKVHTLDIAPLRSESPPQKRSGMARVLKRFHSFTWQPVGTSKKIVLPSICDASLSCVMMWNLPSYPTTGLNERMWHFKGGGQNILWPLLHIFSGSRLKTPTSRICAPVQQYFSGIFDTVGWGGGKCEKFCGISRRGGGLRSSSASV